MLVNGLKIPLHTQLLFEVVNMIDTTCTKEITTTCTKDRNNHHLIAPKKEIKKGSYISLPALVVLLVSTDSESKQLPQQQHDNQQ